MYSNSINVQYINQLNSILSKKDKSMNIIKNILFQHIQSITRAFIYILLYIACIDALLYRLTYIYIYYVTLNSNKEFY